jgi:predicted transcriptional regulator
MKHTAFIYETLGNLGLSRSQTGLYLEFLKNGSSTIAETARNLNTSRQAIYLLLPALLDRGLIKEIKQGKRSLYQALPPSQLFGLLEDLKNRLDTVVPALTNIQSIPADVPLVTVYDTPLAMREWYRHYMAEVQEGDEFLLYDSGSVDTWYNQDPEFYKGYMEKQIEKRIKLLCLLPQNKITEEFLNQVGWSITEYRHTTQSFAKRVEQWIWRDEVCYQTVQGNATNMIVVKSQELADFAKKQFYEIWNASTI